VHEKPQRSWTIWFLDVAKQAFSAILAHFLNLLSSIMLSSLNSDECVWYLIQMVIDSTLGVALCYLIINVFNFFADLHNL
jgi:hypothetical protein